MICDHPQGCSYPAAAFYTGVGFSRIPVCLLHAQEFQERGFGFIEYFEALPTPKHSPIADRLGGRSP